ncbi:MAG: photosynthetic complex assembly protein PuhC [Oceanicaulis sp.]
MTKQEVIHRRAVQGLIVIVIATIAMVGIVQLNGGPTVYEPRTPAVAAAELRFTDEPGGVVAVWDAGTGARLLDYGENEGVFVRSVMRGVARQRRMRGYGPETPVRLSRHESGDVWLTDPASGVQIYLGAFGPDNVGLFEALLDRHAAVTTARTEGAAP